MELRIKTSNPEFRGDPVVHAPWHRNVVAAANFAIASSAALEDFRKAKCEFSNNSQLTKEGQNAKIAAAAEEAAGRRHRALDPTL